MAYAREPLRRPSVPVWLLPCGIAVVYLGIFVTRLPHIIWELGWSSDYASGFTVPEAVVKDGTGGHTVLGTSGLYVPLWFGLLTARLPLHRQLWEMAPTSLFIGSALTIGWSLARIATRRAAALAVLIALIASPAALSVFMASVAHNTTYPCAALLGAYLVWLATGGARKRLTASVVVIFGAVVLGACLASDALLLAAGIIPFSLTAVLACLRRDPDSRRVGLYALATVALAIPVARLTSSIMSASGYVINTPRAGLKLAPLSEAPEHAQLLLSGLERLFNGYLDTGASDAFHTVLGAACNVAMGAALATLLVVGLRAAVTFMLSGWRGAGRTTSKQMAITLHTIYWSASAAAVCSAFVLSDYGEPNHESLYITVVFSTAAIIPLLVASNFLARWLVPIGASLLFAASAVGVASYPIWGVVQLAHYESDVLEMARTYHATTGYAGYSDSSNLTWATHGRIAARPVFECPHPSGANICVFSEETVPAWYAPRHRHSFLLLEAGEFLLTHLPQGLGRPLASYRFGPVQMYIFPYDIASRLGPSWYPLTSEPAAGS